MHFSLHNEVKAVYRDFGFIYTDGFVLNDKAAVAAIIDNSSIERLPDKFLFSAELHALYLALSSSLQSTGMPLVVSTVP